jgi:hypothetical protein
MLFSYNIVFRNSIICELNLKLKLKLKNSVCCGCSCPKQRSALLYAVLGQSVLDGRRIAAARGARPRILFL